MANDDSSKDSIDLILEQQIGKNYPPIPKESEKKTQKKVLNPQIEKEVIIVPKPIQKQEPASIRKYKNTYIHKKATQRSIQKTKQACQEATPLYLKKVESKLKSQIERDRKEHSKSNKPI